MSKTVYPLLVKKLYMCFTKQWKRLPEYDGVNNVKKDDGGVFILSENRYIPRYQHHLKLRLRCLLTALLIYSKAHIFPYNHNDNPFMNDSAYDMLF